MSAKSSSLSHKRTFLQVSQNNRPFHNLLNYQAAPSSRPDEPWAFVILANGCEIHIAKAVNLRCGIKADIKTPACQHLVFIFAGDRLKGARPLGKVVLCQIRRYLIQFSDVEDYSRNRKIPACGIPAPDAPLPPLEYQPRGISASIRAHTNKTEFAIS